MSLKSLFIITLSTLLLIILGIVFVTNIKNTQSFLAKQIYSTSQDTVYSLAMSLSSIDEKDSRVDIELMINAIFDSGYYEYIKYYDINNSIIYETSLPVLVKDIPSWFISITPIELQEATGSINKGWTKAGTLHIKGHSGYAYYALYQNFKSLLITFSIIAFISLSVLIFIINTILVSLKGIKNQANSIAEHKFIIQKSKPFVSEFGVLINSMNKMVTKVESIFKAEVQTFEQYQTLLYKDEETALPNKKYFMLKLKEILDDESVNLGYLAIVSIDGLDKLKQESSYQVYKETLENFIENMPSELKLNNLLARISENDIAVLFETHDISKIESYFTELQDSLNITHKDIKSKEKLLCFSIGVAPYFEDDKLSEALSRVDYSLSRSKINGCNIIDIYDANGKNQELVTLGKSSWKTRFDKIFDENRIILATQSAINTTTKSTYHDEMLVRITEDDGSIHTAGFYLPMANSLGLLSKFDESTIKSVLESIDTYQNPVAVNISKDFVLQSLNFLELRSRLSKLRTSHPQTLHFECSENEILQELDSYVEFADMVHAHKQLFGIDRFSGIQNIGYIEKIRPDYIKVNVNFILSSYENNQGVLNSLNTLSKTMGITLIITAVQHEEQLSKLEEIGYENFQGLVISDIKI
ncbi:EAL domain-containing protein [Sulfurimonas sp. SAG-AH-194-C21]|nr:LapD/MoxY N-terminal periplasmic domain-containing protein [Sulfurimonas sp. SAG-AH-194-C21]MDF1884521.1 EAL domain-containing protein [Sulfurimonas sp. SAG-AH-194-C21]